MSALTITIHASGLGKCCLSGKESDGVTVTFGDGTVTAQHLSWKSLRQLVAMKLAPAKAEPRTAPTSIPAFDGTGKQ